MAKYTEAWGCRFVRCCVCIAVLVLSASYTTARTLVEEGQAAATIVVADKPTRAAQLAAYELQYHVRLITGATLPIVTSIDDVQGLPVCVGDSAMARTHGYPDKDWKFLEYAILFETDAVILAGHDAEDYGELKYNTENGLAGRRTLPPIMDPQGTAHAVYHFLEDYCGVRWWNATEFGTEYPTTTTLEIEERDIRRQPSFLYRDWGGGHTGWPNIASQCFWNDRTLEFEQFLKTAYPRAWSYHLAHDKSASQLQDERPRLLFANHQLWFRIHQTEGIWLRRMRFGGSERFKANHSISPFFARFWNEGDPAHPDWFAQGFEGKPHQLCYTNEEVVQQMAQDARDFFDGKFDHRTARSFKAIPGSDYFPVVPADGGGFCKCPECEALKNPSEKSGHFANGWLSDYWFQFVNRVAREVKKTHPDKFISTLSYASYAKTPSFAPEDNIAVQVCMGVRFATENPTEGHEWEILRDWVQKLPSQRVLLWLYYTFPKERAGDGSRWHVFPGFFMHDIGSIFKEYHRLGCRGAFFNGWGEDVNTYITLKMLNHADTDVDAVLDEFYTDYYGPAAEPMRQLYAIMEKLFSDADSYPNRLGRGHQTPEIAWGILGTHERMETMRGLLEKAYAAVGAERPDDDEERPTLPSTTGIEGLDNSGDDSDADDALRLEEEQPEAAASTAAQRQQGVFRKRIEIFDRGIFSYMEEGREKYLQGIPARILNNPKQGRIPWTLDPVKDKQPENVNWHGAFAMVNWRTMHGEPTLHQPLMRMAHDDTHLYIRYDEFAHPKLERVPGEPEGSQIEVIMQIPGDDSQCVISVTPDGALDKWRQAKNGENQPWDVDVNVQSRREGEKRWIVELAVPLSTLKVMPGDRFRLNAVRRGGKGTETAAWMCPFGEIKTQNQLAVMFVDGLDKKPVDPMPAEQLRTLKTKGLAGHWRFDEANGTIARDSSGNGMDGTYLNMDDGWTQRTPGLNGSALSWTRGRTAVEIKHDGLQDIFDGPFTFEAWVQVKPSLLHNGLPLVFRIGPHSFGLRRNAGRLWFSLKDSNGKRHLINTQDFPREADWIPIRQWTHLAAVYDGDMMRVYLNGRQHGDAVPLAGALKQPEGALKLGGGSSSLALDDVALYNRAFSPAEAMGRFKQGLRKGPSSECVGDG